MAKISFFFQELLAAQQNYWHHVRQDLERCRLMCELVQKRERKKKELLQTYVMILKFFPFENDKDKKRLFLYLIRHIKKKSFIQFSEIM